MRDDSGIQSLERGMAILKILGQKGAQTASSLAAELGIHQSSASRLLQSLQKAGFVRKPGYHSFALDYGVLSFAGLAMAHFPLISAAVKVCGKLQHESACGTAAAILQEGRLLYLARISQEDQGRPILVDDSSFPLHRSSLGLLLAHAQGKKEFCRLMKGSIEICNDDLKAEGLYQLLTESLAKHGILVLKNWHAHRFNAARLFEVEGRCAALAIFSRSEEVPLGRVKGLLEKGCLEIEYLTQN